MSNILIAYYSFSKNTENLALEIALQTGGDLREIVPEQAYSFNYNTATKEARAEIERGYCPKLASGGEPIDDMILFLLARPTGSNPSRRQFYLFCVRTIFRRKRLCPSAHMAAVASAR